MAMKRPHPRVISHKIQHDKTLSIPRIIRVPYIEKLGIPSLWIFRASDGAVPHSRALGGNEEVVAVEVHGVGERVDCVDDGTDGFRLAEIIDIPLGILGI
jgi:hypothetical protein